MPDRHEWDGSYPYSKCRRCAALDLGAVRKTACRGWYYGESREKVYVPSMVAALYVEKGGAYFGLPGVDPWDEERDARLYAGPWPVVAHPPCARWCQLAGLVEHCYGYKKGDDGGTFAAALESVREYGGVLEHPAYSLAWPHFGLPRPGRYGWTKSLTDPGWTTEVSQSTYGAPVRKRTWLYFIGDEPPSTELNYYESRELFHDRVSWLNQPRGKGLSHGESSATPLAFRDVLLDMARSATDFSRAVGLEAVQSTKGPRSFVA